MRHSGLMGSGSGHATLDARLARVIAHPLRHRLLLEYARRPTSPSKVADELREPLNLVSYHTAVLLRAECIELVRTESRRGAKEHFYRTLVHGEIDDHEWSQLPTKLRRSIARRALELFWRDVRRALPSGGMDEPTTHISRSLLSLDQQGRDDLSALLRSTVGTAADLQRASAERGGARADSEVVILHFQRPSAP